MYCILSFVVAYFVKMKVKKVGLAFVNLSKLIFFRTKLIKY